METIKDLKVNLESKVLASKNIVIVPHTNIDFDAFASAIGISLIVSKLQKPNSIIIDDSSYKLDSSVRTVIEDAKSKFNIITKDKYKQDEEDLFVLTDVNKSELICLRDELKKVDKDKIFIIDHHDEGETTIDSNYKFIRPSSSSASEIIVKLLNLFKVKYSPEIANYLLAGIYLDTNRLTNNASSETFKIVGKLMDEGASNSVIDNWFAEDFESDKRVLELISKAIIYKYSYAVVVADEELEYTRAELAKVSDYLLRYGVDAAFSIGNVGENLISISARSKEKVNVGEVMKCLGGGGNHCSAATKLEDTEVNEVAKQLKKIMDPPFLIETKKGK